MFQDILNLLTFNPDNRREDRKIKRNVPGTMFLTEDESISSVYPSGNLKIVVSSFEGSRLKD